MQSSSSEVATVKNDIDYIRSEHALFCFNDANSWRCLGYVPSICCFYKTRLIFTLLCIIPYKTTNIEPLQTENG